jgi:hypothetical protein
LLGRYKKKVTDDEGLRMAEEKDDFNDLDVEEFRQNIQKLYDEVKLWLKGMVFKEVSVDIYEEYAVPYKIAELYILRSDR